MMTAPELSRLPSPDGRRVPIQAIEHVLVISRKVRGRRSLSIASRGRAGRLPSLSAATEY